MARPPVLPGLRRCSLGPVRRLAAIVGVSLACLVPGPGLAQPAPAPATGVTASGDGVTLNFVNAEIDAVVKAVAEITGRNFIVDPRVKGQINIVSARPVPRSLVYPTLLSALRLSGYAAVESDGVVKIVPEADAKTQGGPVGRGSGDRLVTQVIVLRNESAASMVSVLRPLITPNNTIAAFPQSNALVITDYADNLRRIERIIASLDQPERAEPVLVPVKHASAIDIAGMVTRLLADPASPGTPADAQQRVTLVPDPRSNSILVRSDNAGRAARVRALIEQLDTPGRPGGNLFIVYLRNAEAARVAQTLRALLTGTDTAATAGSPLAPPGAFVMGQAQAQNPAPNAPGASPVVTPALPFNAPATQGNGFTAGGVTVQADVANNALIVMAPEPVYNNLRAIIEKLDVRRAQVYVEALIVEVSADRAAELGVQWNVLSGYNNTTSTRVVGGTNFGQRGSGQNIIDVAVNPGTVAPGLNIGIMRGTVTIPGLGVITNLGMLARALETTVNANILSTPALMTLDNEEARIIVGQNVPFVTGSYATTGGTNTVTPFQTVERRDVGLVLRVRPQITEGGAVKLSIYQEVSRIQDATVATGIILSKRALESNVVVDDSNIVVLGGLIEDRMTDGNDKVPIAGDVPVLGSLFRYDARRREKTNLMVFLKPTVLRSGQDGRDLTSERYDYLVGQQQRIAPQPLPYWPDPSRPELPSPGAMPGDGGPPPAGWPVPPHPLAPFVPEEPWPAPIQPLPSPAGTAPAPAPLPAPPLVPNPSLPGVR